MAAWCEERQFFKMPQNCCVPNCTKKKYKTENGEKISYLKFPDGNILKNVGSMQFVDTKEKRLKSTKHEDLFSSF